MLMGIERTKPLWATLYSRKGILTIVEYGNGAEHKQARQSECAYFSMLLSVNVMWLVVFNSSLYLHTRMDYDLEFQALSFPLSCFSSQDLLTIVKMRPGQSIYRCGDILFVL